MASPQAFAVPQGSTVLVTGANGLAGSHIADQFLHYGFKVRAVVRSVETNAWLQDLFEKKYGKGSIEVVEVPDLAAEGAFNEAVKGVAVVVHSASIVQFSMDPDQMVPGSVSFALNAVKAAYAEPSVKRFIFCSSSSTAYLDPGPPGKRITEDTWNDHAVKQAYADPPHPPNQLAVVYGASKTLSERAIWKYHEEQNSERPDIVVNTVLPSFISGRSLDPARQGFRSTAGLIAALYQGQVLDFHHALPPQYFIDAQDVGRLFVAAVLDKVRGQRIFGFAAPHNWDVVLAILRKLEPTRTFPDNFQGGQDHNEIVARGKAEQLLRDLGRPGWTSEEESVANNVESLRGA